jgi:arylformamidase
MPKIIDLSVVIGESTLSPPSVNLQLELQTSYRGPGHWQASKVTMLLHTGTHVDFSKHCNAEGETAADVRLERAIGEAIVIDLTHLNANQGIAVADLEPHAERIREGDIVLLCTGWSDRHWGNFPTYYLESPYCTPEAAQWLMDRKVKGIGFDCFSEYPARLPEFTSDDFKIHKIILDNGGLYIQQLTNLPLLPRDQRFRFFAPFIKMQGAEGSPARCFALLEG